MSCSSAECCHSRRCSANLYSRSQLALRMLLAVSSSLRKSLNFAAHKTQGLRLHSCRAQPRRPGAWCTARRGIGIRICIIVVVVAAEPRSFDTFRYAAEAAAARRCLRAGLRGAACSCTSPAGAIARSLANEPPGFRCQPVQVNARPRERARAHLNCLIQRGRLPSGCCARAERVPGSQAASKRLARARCFVFVGCLVR